MVKMAGYNANEHDPETPSGDFEALPAGVYTAIITSSEETPLKGDNAGKGTKMEFTYQIAEGQFKGRLVWDNVNHNHPSAKAKSFANARLSQICRSLNNFEPGDTEEFHGKPLKIRLKVKKNTWNGVTKDVNEIAEVLPISHAEAPPAQASGVDPATQGNAWGG